MKVSSLLFSSLVIGVATLYVSASPVSDDIVPYRRGDIEINPDDYEDYSEYYKEDIDDDGERSIFSVLKLVGKGILKGSKLVGSAIIKGGTKVVKSGLMKQGKKLVLKGTKKLVGLAAEEAAGMAIEAGVNALLPDQEVQEGEDYEEVEEVDLFEYLGDDSLCTCNTTKECTCCVTVPDYEEACMNITLLQGGSLWKKDSEIRLRTTYGGVRTFNYKFPVRGFDRTCRQLPEEMANIKMCVSTLGRTKEDGKQKQCFSLEFNGHSLLKCVIQEKESKKLTMGL